MKKGIEDPAQVFGLSFVLERMDYWCSYGYYYQIKSDKGLLNVWLLIKPKITFIVIPILICFIKGK